MTAFNLWRQIFNSARSLSKESAFLKAEVQKILQTIRSA